MNTSSISRMKVVAIMVITGGLWFGGMTGMVLAKDLKMYPASFCKPQDGYQAGKFARYSGKIWNYDKVKTLKVECPVTRDNTTNTNGLVGWGMVGKNYHRWGSLTCAMVSKDYKTGNILAKETARLLFSGNQQPRKVYILSGPKKSLSNGMSYYVLSCEIPPWNGHASYLAAYAADEP